MTISLRLLSFCIAAVLFLSPTAAPAVLDVAVLTGSPLEEPPYELVTAIDGQTISFYELDALDANSLLVLIEAQRFPAPALEHVMAHLDRGGHVLAVGGPVFDTLLHKGPNGIWQTLDELLSMVDTPFSIVSSEAVQRGQYRLATGLDQDQLYIETGPDGLFKEAHFPIADGWSKVVFDVEPPPDGHNVLRVHGALDGFAHSLTAEVQEQDGSRWMAGLRPLEGRDEFIAHEHQFTYWPDSPSMGRGGPGDQLQLDQAHRISIGFASNMQTILPRKYAFRLVSVRTGRIDPDAIVRFEAPPLEGLCPSYKTFTTAPARVQAMGIAAGIDFVLSGEVVSPIPRPMHPHPDLDTTWQPLVKGYDERGVWNSTPVSTTWRDDGASWTFIGFVPDIEPLAAFIRRLSDALPEGMPEPGPREPLREPRTEGARITVHGGRFRLDGEPWFAHGVNYWPLYVGGMEPDDYFAHWLGAPHYIPELIEQDLDLLESMGVNLVSIQYHRPDEAPQLRDFVARCHDRGIVVYIYIADAHPTEPMADDDLTERGFMDLIKAADLAGVPSVLAYDIAWEPAFGVEATRAKHDHLFEAWVIEQYGSIDWAEEVWGIPANRRENGGVAGPTNEQIMSDGEHRVMVAAYRRFKDDLISQRYREIIRLIKEVDDTHLFGVRTGLGGTGIIHAAVQMPFQLTSGAAHLDFISPEGWGYTHDNNASAAFVGQYARWAGHGKPVFWSEFGESVWDGGPEFYLIQRDIYQGFREMVERTSADGWAAWWYPGGFRVDTPSDYGIVNPDQSLRPAAMLMWEAADSLKDIGPLPDYEPMLTVHRDEHPTGLAHLVVDRMEAYTKAWEAGEAFGVQSPGTGTASADCPYTGVGGVPFAAPQPPEYLNAEIVLRDHDGSTVEVTLINTGEATWLAEDCRVRVVESDGSTAFVALPENVPRFGRLDVVVPAPEGATLVLEAERFGPFGERANLE